jgi:hypothetical protein
MNAGWAEHLSRQRIGEFEQEARGGHLLRRARADNELSEPVIEAAEARSAPELPRRPRIDVPLSMLATRARRGVAGLVSRTSAWGERR